jgi:hypothetical protein
MNNLTKQLLDKVGYDYPDFAVMAQKLILAVAGTCAAIADDNGDALTAADIITAFSTPDEVLTEVTEAE